MFRLLNMAHCLRVPRGAWPRLATLILTQSHESSPNPRSRTVAREELSRMSQASCTSMSLRAGTSDPIPPAIHMFFRMIGVPNTSHKHVPPFHAQQAVPAMDSALTSSPSLPKRNEAFGILAWLGSKRKAEQRHAHDDAVADLLKVTGVWHNVHVGPNLVDAW